MICTNCGEVSTKVIDSRELPGHCFIYRKRWCPSCGEKFFTYEISADYVRFLPVHDESEKRASVLSAIFSKKDVS